MQSKNRAQARNTAHTLTLDWIAELIQRADHRCQHCGKRLQRGKQHLAPTSYPLDEKIPGLGYTPENTGLLCFDCNTRKRDLNPGELMSLLVYMVGRESAKTVLVEALGGLG